MRHLIVTIKRPRIAIPLLVVFGLLLLQVGLELISWTVLSGLFLLAWPILTAILVALVGFRLLLKLKSFMYAAGWTVLVIFVFVAIQFALNSIGTGGVNIPSGGPVADWPSYGRDLGGSS